MQLSKDRILTTHVGSLPRPEGLRSALISKHMGQQVDPDDFERQCVDAVTEVVSKQVECGVDVLSDGEMSKISYVGYVRHRLSGIHEGAPVNPTKDINSLLPTNVSFPDIAEHPDFAAYRAQQGSNVTAAPIYAGPLSYGDEGPLRADIARFKSAATSVSAKSLFLNSASPGVLAMFIPTDHYGNDDEYVSAIAKAMKTEYEAIYRAGILLQLDCPDLAMSWHMRFWQLGEREFIKMAHRNVEALNYATSNIPPEAMRLHICWGNYAGPHTHDIPIAKLFELISKSRPQSILFEGANPRHEHEWEDWRSAKIPNDKHFLPTNKSFLMRQLSML